MKKYFTTGLAILLPVVLTVLILSFLINLLTKPFIGEVKYLLTYYGLATSPAWLIPISKTLILTGIFLLTLLVGLIGKVFLIDYLFRLGDFLIHRIPLINKIYKACQDVVHSLLSSESKSFSQVVFVPFPTSKTLSVGLVTKDAVYLESHTNPAEMLPIFVPGTPNPAMGFMLMFRRDQVIFVNMTVEEAMKFVVSCGVVTSDFKITPLAGSRIEPKKDDNA
jgi:uncharacterized membrane protein